MKNKIKYLTEEQKALLPVYRDRWLKIGLATGPADRAKSEDAILRAYKIAGLELPKQIIWSTSPLAGSLVISILKNEKIMKEFLSKIKIQKNSSNLPKLGDSITDSVWDSIRDSVTDSVWDSVGASVRYSVWDSVGASVRYSVWDSVGTSVWDSITDSVWDSIRDSVTDSVGASVGDSVWDSVRDSVRDSVVDSIRDSVRYSVGDSVWAFVRISVGDSVNKACYGSHDASWLGFYQYFLEVLKIESCKKFIPLMDFSKEGGWFYPYKNICVISERPTEIHMNGSRLHRDGGPVIVYSDGFSVYALNGVRVPQWLAERSKNDLTSKEIMGLTNVQQRAEGIKKVGIGALLSEMKAETLHTYEDYKLITIEFEGRRVGPYLQMVNPSTGEIHVEGVGEPNGAVDNKIKTCQQAMAWRNTMPLWNEPIILT